MKKRLFAMLLAMVLVLGLMPANAFAEAVTGTCGENVTWVLDTDGTLTLSGQGPTYHYQSEENPWLSPFYRHRDAITRVVVEEGVTTIGNHLFNDCGAMKMVSLPQSLTSIGVGAFYDCLRLTTITFPEGLTSIGADAFYYCGGLGCIALPAGLETIGSRAFGECIQLRVVLFQKGLTELGENVFHKSNALSHVYYEGTEGQWKQLANHEQLTNRKYLELHYGVTPVAVLPFTDVPEQSFYRDSVLWALWENVTNGMGDGTFGAAQPCNRAQVVTFLWRAAGCPEPTSTECAFTDVDVNEWYGKAVLWAVENGITNGMGDGTFGVNTSCNRAQVVTFLWRVAGCPEFSSYDDPGYFTDVDRSQWYATPVLWCWYNSIARGLSTETFGINEICNRAQIVTFLYRAYAR